MKFNELIIEKVKKNNLMTVFNRNLLKKLQRFLMKLRYLFIFLNIEIHKF